MNKKIFSFFIAGLVFGGIIFGLGLGIMSEAAMKEGRADVKKLEVTKEDEEINILGGARSQDSSAFTEVRITNNPNTQAYPKIFGNRVVWQDNRYGNYDIFSYDITTASTTRITTSTSQEQFPDIYGDKVIWQDFRNGNDDIYMYDFATSQETRITTSTKTEVFAKIYQNKISWVEKEYATSTPEIYLYDLETGEKTFITNEAYIPNGSYSYDFYNDIISWTNNLNIYAYHISLDEESRITTSTIQESSPSTYRDRIVWTADIPNTQGRIVERDLSESPSCVPFDPEFDDSICPAVLISTGSSSPPSFPSIFGEKVVWADYDDFSHTKVAMFDRRDGSEAVASSYDAKASYPTLYDGKVVWMDNRGGNFEVYMVDTGSDALCADLDDSNAVDATDLSFLVDHVFFGGSAPDPFWVGDLDGNGFIDATDMSVMIDYIFFGGATPTCEGSELVAVKVGVLPELASIFNIFRL